MVHASLPYPDSTGSLADAVADVLGLPTLINALHARLGDDLAVANTVQPWLWLIFESAVEHEAAEARALAAPPLAARSATPEVLLVRACQRASDLALLCNVAWAWLQAAAAEERRRRDAEGWQ